MSDCNCFVCNQMEKYINEPEIECPICFDSINPKVNSVITECGHRFHSKCLMENVMHNGFGCPYCRSDMVDKPIINRNVIEQEYEYIDENENMELEEGEIVRTDFQEFADRQRFHDEMHELYYSLTSFRMFQQRIEGEEPEEEEEEELRERLDMERRDRKNQRDAEYIITSVSTNNNITKEDLIRAILYGSFQNQGHHLDTYFKVYGKIKGTIMARSVYNQVNRPIPLNT